MTAQHARPWESEMIPPGMAPSRASHSSQVIIPSQSPNLASQNPGIPTHKLCSGPLALTLRSLLPYPSPTFTQMDPQQRHVTPSLLIQPHRVPCSALSKKAAGLSGVLYVTACISGTVAHTGLPHVKAQTIKIQPTMQEVWLQSLGRESWRKGTATHS